MKKSVLLAGIVLMLADSAAAEKDNVHFSGALVAETCTLPDADTDIKLDFGAVIGKDLYQYQRTKSQPFTIHLQNCDPDMMSTVNVTFQGLADPALTDMLALDASSTAKGVAIGIELPGGTLLPVNKASPWKQLAKGNNELTFNAFVQAQPVVIANKTLVSGDFTATTTFVLNYQ